MSKRRRASSVASRGVDCDDSDDGVELSNPGPPPSRKKKKLEPSEICQQLYDIIRSYKKEDGTLLCDSFIRAPKRRQEPQYYEVVSQPIDLLRVQQKLKTDTYEDIEELTADIELLVNNAKAFYKHDSEEYKDAIELWKLYGKHRNALESGEELKTPKSSRNGSSSRRSDVAEDVSETSTNNDEDNVFEELFNAVMTANVDGRPLYPAFQFLPSKRRYPDYFSVIDSPIDLKIIAQKIQGGEYTHLSELDKDLSNMVRNACLFNEPGSQIYKDAKTLKKIIQVRKQEIEQHGRSGPAKTSERIRSKRTSRVGPAPSSRALAIMEPPGSDAEPEVKHSEDSGGETDEEKNDNEDSPQWKLLEVVKNHLGPSGSPMANPFWKLPSRRVYPDYYKEIKNPVSLNQIKNKIRRGAYGTLSEVAGDMNIMFENAKQYNVATSRLYKDAVKLQRLMQQRVQELLDIVQSSSSDDESLSSVKNHAQAATPRPRGRPRINPLPASAASPTMSPVVPKSNVPLKKKLHFISKQLVEFTCSDGRQPMLLFMEKPSKKLYPEYYNVIERPIDMLTIEANIKNDRYNSIEEMTSDFRLMFSNCRQFNEEGSMIYEDANLLERVMNEKLKELTSANYERKPPLKTFKAAKSKQLSPFEQKLRTLYDAIRDYRDPKVNRQLALIFMKLPNKSEYPDYYELIKNPIDMEKIAHKLKNGLYTAVNELASDFILMFDNACKYNEPDSQIYKDALILQRVCLQTKQMLREDDDAIPDVPAAVQELLLNLFTTIYNHQDEEGRCYSDSMAELPEHDEATNGQKVRAISLDLVKRRLDKGLYKRLDHFQQDIFAVFERARRLSRTDSQIFEDSVELQSYFIEQRDILCRNTLTSPALTFTRDTISTSVELVKQCKLLQENDEEDETRSSTEESMSSSGAPPPSQYAKGDFVYIQPEKGNKEPSIVQIERLWTNSDNVHMVYSNVYFRPHETFHVRTRKFLQQEVFKTEAHRTVPLDQVIGRCYVMNVKKYFKFRPEGYLNKDVYVCESRYNSKNRWFKKIKVWEGAEKEATLTPREVPLEPNRTVSVFRERVEKHKDELAELEVLENVQEKERPDVVMYNPLGTDDENTYYEQYNTVCSGVIKTGDYVYVVTDGGKQMIAQVDTIWETADNKCYFRGPFLIFPSEVANIITKPFYKQEVLLTTMHDTSPLVGIVGKCGVLDYDDYLKCRPTEIAETDMYVCESVYDESNRVARKLKTGLRKFEHTKDVTVDEIYYFPKQLGPPALATAQDVQSTSSAFTQKPFNPNVNADSMDGKPQFTNLINTTIGSQDVEMLLENSLDDSSLASPATPLSIGGNSNPYNPSMAPSSTQERTSQAAATPTSSSKKKKEQKQKIVTGYILYSSEVRKAIVANNPESTFGEISRIVGNEWRSLPASTKQSWEERAAKCNEETSARLAEEMRELTQHTPMEMTYECAWDTCDYQFEDLSDCMEHCIGDGGNMIGTFIETKKTKLEPGHIQQHYRAGGAPTNSTSGNSEYPCLWRSCARVRKGQAPFPNLPRLLRHVRDLHVNKGNGRPMAGHERSRNHIPSSKKPPKQYAPAIRGGLMSPGGMSPMARNTPSPGAGESSGAGIALGPPARAGHDPLFVAAPPRAQRVTHSEAYIRYIEGLHSEQKYITPWEKSLTPMPANPDPAHFNMHKLPSHWLTEETVNGYLQQDKSVAETDVQKMDQNTKILKGLCALRDFMMRDALAIYKSY
ncbi:protein polybromo-1 isoform X1 [Pararge aegeria]|nr:protein polybromo-1 isoform X1 [Pararge aegeria]